VLIERQNGYGAVFALGLVLAKYNLEPLAFALVIIAAMLSFH
jgi:hypothetical protein